MNSFETKLISKSNEIIKELGASDVYSALAKLKEQEAQNGQSS